MDYVNACNDRNEKILEFHHPEELKKLLDLDINQQPVSLQQLVFDCATTMKHSVKTGEKIVLKLAIIKTIINKTYESNEIFNVAEYLIVNQITEADTCDLRNSSVRNRM